MCEGTDKSGNSQQACLAQALQDEFGVEAVQVEMIKDIGKTGNCKVVLKIRASCSTATTPKAHRPAPQKQPRRCLAGFKRGLMGIKCFLDDGEYPKTHVHVNQVVNSFSW